MAYSPTTWVNNGAPAIDATALNKMEQGIAAAHSPTLAMLPAGVTVTVQKTSGGTWPARPTARADVTVIWKGPDPSPPIVNSGTGGMLNGVDERHVTP